MKKMFKKELMKNVRSALLTTPVVSFAILIIAVLLYTPLAVIADADFWKIIPFGFIFSFIFFYNKKKYINYREKKKLVDALVLYWTDRVVLKKKVYPSERLITLVRAEFQDRLNLCLLSDSWLINYYDSKCSTSLFEIVDDLQNDPPSYLISFPGSFFHKKS